MTRRLGRLHPEDRPEGWTHVDKYPLLGANLADAIVTPRPVVLGVNWYTSFYSPVKDNAGHWWIGRNHTALGTIAGGHAVALKPRRTADPLSWWSWYNQVNEGICVSEAVSRAASHYNRKQYQPRPLYDECKARDGYAGEGTWVSVGFDVLRTRGAVAKRRYERHFLTSAEVREAGADARFDAAEGISANRWIRSIDDCLAVLGYTGVGYVDVLNSWGRDYPHLVRMPVETLERLWWEDGEIGVSTDR